MTTGRINQVTMVVKNCIAAIASLKRTETGILTTVGSSGVRFRSPILNAKNCQSQNLNTKLTVCPSNASSWNADALDVQSTWTESVAKTTKNEEKILQMLHTSS